MSGGGDLFRAVVVVEAAVLVVGLGLVVWYVAEGRVVGWRRRRRDRRRGGYVTTWGRRRV